MRALPSSEIAGQPEQDRLLEQAVRPAGDARTVARTWPLGPLLRGRVTLTRLGRFEVVRFIDAFGNPEIAFDELLEQILTAIRLHCAFGADGAIEGVVFELSATDSYFGRTEFLILGPDDLMKCEHRHERWRPVA